MKISLYSVAALAMLGLVSCDEDMLAQSPTGTVSLTNILDNSLYVGKVCTNYNTAYFNVITGSLIRCLSTSGNFNASLNGTWQTVNGGGGGGSAIWGGITGSLSNQGDLATALAGKQNTLSLPLSVANGGTGTATPGLLQGSNITITGTWPNQTISSTGGGGSGASYTFSSPLNLSGSNVSLLASGVSAGSYTCPNLTVDALGRLTSASSGTCSGGTGSTAWGSITGTLSAQTDLQNALNLKITNPMNSIGDIILGGSSGAPTRLGAGTSGYSLVSNGPGTAPSWQLVSGGGGGTAYTFNSPLSLSGSAVSLLSSGATPGTYGSSTLIPVLTVDTYGRITSVTTATSSGGGGGGGVATSFNKGTSLPGTCTTGDVFFITSNTPNRQSYWCSGTNTWTQNMLLGGLGALTIDGTTGALDIVPTVVPRLAQANIFTARNTFSTVQDFTMIATPAASASGKIGLYANTDGSLHYINAAGTDAALATGAGFANPMTTQDDIIVGGASGTPTRLAKGADSQVLGVDPGTHHLAYLNQTGGSGGGTPAGNDGDFQINSAGAFGAGPIKYTANYMSNPRLALGDTTAFSPYAYAYLKTAVNAVTLTIENTNASGYTQMAAQGGRFLQWGVGNASETALGVAGKYFIYDGGTTPTAGDGKGLMMVADSARADPTIDMRAALRVVPTSTDPGCTNTTTQPGKFWMDSTSASNFHLKVCSVTASAAGWVQIF